MLLDVVPKLKLAGFCCMTIIDVAGLGELIDPKEMQPLFLVAPNLREKEAVLQLKRPYIPFSDRHGLIS